MSKIALIPIDNRPVCYTLPKDIISLNPSNSIIMPDRKLLGSLTKNADSEAIFEWLEEIRDIDYLVIAADTLIYGGLIPSRRSNLTLEEIEQRIIRLRNILLKKEDCKTFLFSSIMRISNNNVNEEEKEYWSEWGEKLFSYSYNLHRSEAEGNSVAKARSRELSAEIPKEILIDWLSTRARNFEVNKMYLKLYDDGLIDTLIYAKDDCSQFGLNIKEAKYFDVESINRKGVIVKTGADEIPLALISRSLSDGKKIKIATVYTQPKSIKKISKYEDISVEESVKSQLSTAGIIVTDEEKADLILYVNNFKKEQGELVMDVEEEGFKDVIQKFNRPYFTADILNANGADNNFAIQLLDSDLTNFYGYSAWNTTGNTLGSAIAIAVSKFTAKNPDEEAFKKIQTIRFLDDWAYQANLRKKIKNEKITDKNEIKKLFSPYEKTVGKAFEIKKDIEYSFPWNRSFEIEITI